MTKSFLYGRDGLETQFIRLGGRSMKKKPIYLMHQEGVDRVQVEAVLEATIRVLLVAGMENDIQIHNLGVWRNTNWKVNGSLTMWNSVDWYIEHAQQASPNNHQINASDLMTLLLTEPWNNKPHYDIVITKEDMCFNGANFVIGLAGEGIGTVVSTKRFEALSPEVQRECIVTETMHELGHVFGLIPATRTKDVESSLGLHCTNRCIMRQGLRVPDDWITITQDRLKGYNFCPACREDLGRFFS